MLRFTRASRLLTRKQFQHVLQAPKKYRSFGFSALIRENSEGCARLGLAVSKRNIPKANQRNRLKRLVRESFRHQVQLPAFDIVIFVYKAAQSADPKTLKLQLDSLWIQIISANR